MSNADDHKPLSLKVAINKEKTKVLFAEANNKFVDVLLSFLALPLGKMVTNLEKITDQGAAAVVGSLNSLYAGLSDLNDSYFSWKGAKQMLLNPRSSSGAECHRLALDITDSPKKYYRCPDLCRHWLHNFSMYSDIGRCKCGKPLNHELLGFKESPGGGGFTVDPSFFIVTDDLCVAPIVAGIFQTLNNLGYTDTDTQGVEMKSLSFGIHEIRVLLKLALTSATPLTDMVIKKTHASAITTIAPKAELSWYHHIPKEKAHSRKIALKVSLQKSTNKFLFAEATAEFVELLFSFLTVSLGGVEFLLGGNTALKNIDNIYRSVSYGIDNKYFKTRKSKEMLVNPKLPYGYISKNQFLPLSEEAPNRLYLYNREYLYYEEPQDFFDKFASAYFGASGSIKLNKDLYVKKLYHLKKETLMYIVSDDLSVSPSLATSISIISSLGIPRSDVKEMVLPIGLEEALRILKASLTSKTAITDGLINPMLNQLPN